jgi:hypothetical protein
LYLNHLRYLLHPGTVLYRPSVSTPIGG